MRVFCYQGLQRMIVSPLCRDDAPRRRWQWFRFRGSVPAWCSRQNQDTSAGRILFSRGLPSENKIRPARVAWFCLPTTKRGQILCLTFNSNLKNMMKSHDLGEWKSRHHARRSYMWLWRPQKISLHMYLFSVTFHQNAIKRAWLAGDGIIDQ